MHCVRNLGLCVLALCAGCDSSSTPATPDGGGADATTPASLEEALDAFVDQQCEADARCGWLRVQCSSSGTGDGEPVCVASIIPQDYDECVDDFTDQLKDDTRGCTLTQEIADALSACGEAYASIECPDDAYITALNEALATGGDEPEPTAAELEAVEKCGALEELIEACAQPRPR